MFDTEKFICEIELRSVIRDVCSKSYSNKTEKTRAWEEICSSFIDNFEDLEKDEKIIFVAKALTKAIPPLQNSWSTQLSTSTAHFQLTAAKYVRRTI